MFLITLIAAALFATPGSTMTLGTHTDGTYQGDHTEMQIIQITKLFDSTKQMVVLGNLTLKADIYKKKISASDIQAIAKSAENKMKSAQVSTLQKDQQTEAANGDLPLQRCLHDDILEINEVPRKEKEMITIWMNNCVYAKNHTLANSLLYKVRN